VIHFEDQFLLDFTQAKEARLVPREGLYMEKKKNKKERVKKRPEC
jgi:hypothetical protein